MLPEEKQQAGVGTGWKWKTGLEPKQTGSEPVTQSETVSLLVCFYLFITTAAESTANKGASLSFYIQKKDTAKLFTCECDPEHVGGWHDQCFWVSITSRIFLFELLNGSCGCTLCHKKPWMSPRQRGCDQTHTTKATRPIKWPESRMFNQYIVQCFKLVTKPFAFMVLSDKDEKMSPVLFRIQGAWPNPADVWGEVAGEKPAKCAGSLLVNMILSTRTMTPTVRLDQVKVVSYWRASGNHWLALASR